MSARPAARRPPRPRLGIAERAGEVAVEARVREVARQAHARHRRAGSKRCLQPVVAAARDGVDAAVGAARIRAEGTGIAALVGRVADVAADPAHSIHDASRPRRTPSSARSRRSRPSGRWRRARRWRCRWPAARRPRPSSMPLTSPDVAAATRVVSKLPASTTADAVGAPPRRVTMRMTEPMAFEPYSALCGPRTISIRSTFTAGRCAKSKPPPKSSPGRRR